MPPRVPSWIASRILPVLLVAAFAAPAPAGAQDDQPAIGILSIDPAPGMPPAQARRVRDLTARAFRNYRVRVIDDHPALVAARGEGADATAEAGLKQARVFAREGKKLFDDLDSAGAEAKFRAAANLFEQNVGAMNSLDDLTGTYLLLARVFFATEREVLARDIFRRLVQLQPDLVLDRANHPPGMISVFEDVKKLTLASPLGAFRVEAVPGPARVYLDARDRGVTPLELVNIPAGVHVITVRRPGYAPWTRPVDVTSFRVDTLKAELALDRHPNIDRVFSAKGPEEKDAMGATIGDYLDAVARTAGLDVVLVGRAARARGGIVLQFRGWRASTRTLGPVHAYEVPSARALDDVAGKELARLAAEGWIPPIAARRNVAAGGGALDDTARLLVRASLVPGVRMTGGGANFPASPAGGGARIGADYRLGPRLLLTAETGIDAVSQSNTVLEDGDGTVVAPREARIRSVYTSIPLEAGARWYFGVGTLAPFGSAGLGIRWDSIQYQEGLPFDSIRGSSGLGMNAFLGGGMDYALSTRGGLFVEARLHAGTVGVRSATVRTRATPPVPDRSLPVDPGLLGGARIYLGYLRVF